jgi:NAD(P)H-hydrate epimerase
MIKIVSIAQMREIEAAANATGLTYDVMMENAGSAVARRAIELLRELPDPNDSRVTVLVGTGNNGGDGLVAARVIAQNSPAQVRVYLLKKRPEDDPQLSAARAAGLFIADAEDDQRYRVLTNMIASGNILIDAVFGIGVKLPLRDEALKVLRAVHKALTTSEDVEEPLEGEVITPEMGIAPKQPSRPYILAVDCPSGLNCDTGEIDKNAIAADETVTFIAAKPGLLMFPGAESVGKLTVATIGVPASTNELKAEKRILVDAEYARELLPARTSNTHKGSFGKTLIIGGSVNYTGAAGMAAQAAYRSGAGLVAVGTPAPVAAALAANLLEATWLLFPHDMGVLAESAAPLIRTEAANYTSMVIGCGINHEKTTREMLRDLFTQNKGKPPAKRGIGFMTPASVNGESDDADSAPLPQLIIDADGLNLLSEIDEWWTLLPERTILTPHAGEMGRLAKLEREKVERDRWKIVLEKAAEWKCVVLLKGAHTLIADLEGQLAVLPFKTSALSTAGTGDVLAGLIGGFLAQGVKPFDAAVLSGYLHGLAGLDAARRLGGERTVIAGDVLESLPAALKMLGG